MAIPLPDPVESREFNESAARVRPISTMLRLPLRDRVWRGAAGNWAGSGSGSSIDFQDHRPYLPGDDPRHIDWQAYARSGQFTMKLYREEVSPAVDVALDLSASLWSDSGKRARTLDLLLLCIESAMESGSALRVHTLGVEGPRLIPPEQLRAGVARIAPTPMGESPIPLDLVPWRSGSLRIWITDLLSRDAPEPLLRVLAHAKGRGLLFAPFVRAESDPDWMGNLEMRDPELPGVSRHQRIDPELRARYATAYAAHFERWRGAARKYGVRFARIPGDGALRDALHLESVAGGLLEIRA